MRDESHNNINPPAKVDRFSTHGQLPLRHAVVPTFRRNGNQNRGSVYLSVNQGDIDTPRRCSQLWRDEFEVPGFHLRIPMRQTRASLRQQSLLILRQRTRTQFPLFTGHESGAAAWPRSCSGMRRRLQRVGKSGSALDMRVARARPPIRRRQKRRRCVDPNRGAHMRP